MFTSSRPPDFEAEIQFIATEAGGRRSPVASGYRPTHDFGIPEMHNGATHEYPDNESVAPGQTVGARLWLFSPQLQNGRLHPGFEFTVQEGGRIVGRGVITRVINESLSRNY